MKFDQLPGDLSEELTNLEKQKQKHENKLNAIKRSLVEKKRKEENRQVYTLGGIFRHFGWLWVDQDIAMGMIKDQMDKLESYHDQNHEMLEHWRTLGEKEREKRVLENHGSET